MKNFVAIDFETANYEPTSICSVGLVVVRGGEITQRMHRLVCPEPDYYIRRFSEQVHGIYPAMLHRYEKEKKSIFHHSEIYR